MGVGALGANAMFAKLSDVTKALSGGKAASEEGRAALMQFGFACCAMKLADLGASRIDAGKEVRPIFRENPQQCDVMIVSGWTAKSEAPRMRKLYEQMKEPRHVIAYGECAVSGGPWWQSYNTMQGIDQVLPVDVYVVGCPPKPENLFAAHDDRDRQRGRGPDR